MFLADLPAASNRFAPYAAMSALAYAEDVDCGTEDPKLTPEDRAKLESYLMASGWQELKDVQWVPPCEMTRVYFSASGSAKRTLDR